jgi:hypothetical protein
MRHNEPTIGGRIHSKMAGMIAPKLTAGGSVGKRPEPTSDLRRGGEPRRPDAGDNGWIEAGQHA